MDQPGKRQSMVYRIVVLLAVAAGLAAVALLLRGASDVAAEPLYLEDNMTAWRPATAAQKRATAEMLLDHFDREDFFGPKTRAALASSRGRRRLADELIAGLNAAAGRDLPEYVPPTQAIHLTANRVAVLNGWDQ